MDKQEGTNIVVKIAYLLPSIIVGLFGKYATDIALGRKQSKIKWIAIGILSVCAGIFSAWMCTLSGVSGTKASIIQCTATLLGEKIFIFISLKSGDMAKMFALSWLNNLSNLIKNKNKSDNNN